MFPDRSIDRRGFLAGAVTTACATGLVGVSVAGASTPSSGTLHDLSCGDFAEMIGSSFHVAGIDDREAPVEVELVLRQAQCGAHPSDKLRPAHIRPSGFSRLFEVPSATRLASGTHTVTVEGFAPCQLLLDSGVGGGYPHRRFYEAVFN
ncbi:MAG: hypothetical protein ABI614_01635 [Planctomycetota bacterium]